jgi:ATP-dependent DNA helicase RecG
VDFKSKLISPSKLQITFVAFANTDGGDIFVGIEDPECDGERIQGFENIEAVNGVLDVLLEQTKPAVEGVNIEFIDFDELGVVLHASIPKSPKVHYTAQEKCYIRVNANNKEIKGERVLSLGYAKDSYQYEKQAVTHVEIDDVIEEKILIDYMTRIESKLDPRKFLQKQRLTEKKDGVLYPNVCCVLLFDEEPQATLDTRCSVKLYRMKTTSREYDRKYLDGMPKTITGSLEQQINNTLSAIDEMLDDTLYKVDGDYKRRKYPTVAIKEVIVNAIIHRDYSLNDDIHVIIYDDRIEIKSPGRLPGFVTKDNIYDERYSRNPNIVRMLHNLPDPPNHDIGEGLNTVRNELQQVGLVPPLIDETENSVVVTIQHTRIASIEQVVRDLFRENPSRFITNKIIREESGEQNINIVKKALQNLRKVGYIKLKDSKVSYFNYKYVLGDLGEKEWIDS